MITKQQAVYLMELVDGIDDASAAMAATAGRDHDVHVEASMLWTDSYRKLRDFVESITETNE
ncbi:hypothetical protein STP03_051 [Salmonella phage STP03]|uniref:Uncharacterized protein n=1 Tax=Salmonella phage STP03 TaxID=1914788 RepID=A0A1U9HWR2_9CAUD|nr:hypothetical protein QA065_gp49 [Salmonella phage STP03]APM00305.1 hypothetical protein STP03_051 [Salmonella phage STP03]